MNCVDTTPDEPRNGAPPDREDQQTPIDDGDIPIELLAIAQIGERIWPRVFPGL